MDINDPATWHDLATHPAFSGCVFDPSWYDGDVVAELQMFRQVALAITKEYPAAKCELVVLDDCTTYVVVDLSDGTRCEIFNTLVDNNQSHYYVDVEWTQEELRVASTGDVINILKQAPRG